MNPSDLQSLFIKIETASTPDGRWNLLQDWLNDNPEWKEPIDKWLKLPSDDVMRELEETIANKYGLDPLMVRLMTPASVKHRAKSTIETLQTLYRERQGDQKKRRAKNNEQ